MKLRLAVFLAVVMISVMAVAGPALARATSMTGSSGMPLRIETAPDELSGNAGQYVRLPARITNTSGKPVKNVIAYVTLVETTKGQQAPVDLEDWSAHRAVRISSLAPGRSRNVSWDLRLIKGGYYVVYASAIEQGSTRASVGQEIPLFVTAHKNLNPGGVLPVAIGVPVVAGLALFGPVFLRRRSFSPQRAWRYPDEPPG
jgi:uncharacterized membrane protein